MFEIKGKYAVAVITTDNIEAEAIAQITELVNDIASEGSKIVIMPDCHAGKGCVIGTTMTIGKRVVPNLVGVDIGCGVACIKIPANEIDLEKLDKVIHKNVPSGTGVHAKEREYSLMTMHSLDHLYTPLTSAQKSRVLKSLGTLGSGNHFCECSKDNNGNYYLIVHTGSRNLGKLIAEHHQKVAIDSFKVDTKTLIQNMKANGRDSEIQTELAKIKPVSFNKDLAYLEDDKKREYLIDMMHAQLFAQYNRRLILMAIFNGMGWVYNEDDIIDTIHNYISAEDWTLRKGAVSSTQDFLVPLNMRDGTLILKGKYNEAWNNSAPHGAGRAMSRSKAKQELSLEDFKDQMIGVYSTTINQGTLDEAPDAYKPSQEIIDLLKEQYEIIAYLKPIYNFKASE